MSPVPAECREISLNTGGNTDERFALSIWCSGLFLFRVLYMKTAGSQAGLTAVSAEI